jgi:hypothetical protein
MKICMRHAIALVGLLGWLSCACAQDFRIEDSRSLGNADLAQLKPDIILFNDIRGDAGATDNLIPFADWTQAAPIQKKFLSLFPSYTEPTITKAASANHPAGPVAEKLVMYIAQARFVLDRAPGTIDLSRYVTLAFVQKIDPAIKHSLLAAGDINKFDDPQGTGNDNPQRKWCTGRTPLICVQSSYKLEGRIPIGILLVNKLRDSAKKVSDHIEFQSELSQLGPADLDQDGVKQLTGIDAPVVGALEQNLFYVNQIMKFGKLFAVFQAHPTEADKTVVTAFVALAIDESVLDKKKEYENVPVLRNLVPAQVLMGESSFNSGDSISAGLPKYARNQIKTIAGLLARDQ